MAFIVADRVQETCAAPGTGAVALLGAVTQYQSFSVAVGANNTTHYTITDQVGSGWEVGLGTIGTTGLTLTRTTVLSSSNAGALVNFSTGVQNVWCDYPASKAVYGTGTTLVAPTGTLLPVANGGTGLASLTATYIPYGNGTSAYSSSASLNYTTTTLSAPQVNASNGIYINSKTVAASYSIPSGSSAMSVGPITIASGQSVTVPTGSKWVVL